MRQMGIAALGPKPRTSKPAPGHKVYPFSIGACRCQALSDFSIGPVLMSVAGSALLFEIGTEAVP